MLLFTTALAATVNLGYPCSRLNWGWRLVWSTCSINSYNAHNDGTRDHIPAHYRAAPMTPDFAVDWGLPATAMGGSGGVMGPAADSEVPKLLCAAMESGTGGVGTHSALRNRCRRAIDAYGGLVRMCSLAPDVATPNKFRGPLDEATTGNVNLLDWEPADNFHSPHVANVAALNAHARYCTESAAPGTFKSPSTTCPGLLGWFTVVWAACRFHVYSPLVHADFADGSAHLAPLGDTVQPAMFWDSTTGLQDTPQHAGVPGFIFCNPLTGITPGANADAPKAWFERVPNPDPTTRTFRSTRCRKALDQLGRTAERCGVAQNLGTSGDFTPVEGSADKLLAFLGGHNAATIPMGFVNLAPLCN